MVRNDGMLTQSLVNRHIGRARNRERRVRHPGVQCTVNLGVRTPAPPFVFWVDFADPASLLASAPFCT